jgi:hypothetical protein
MSEALSGLPTSLFADTTASAGLAEAAARWKKKKVAEKALYHHSH